MNRREFIQKFSLLSLGLSTIPALLANNKSDDVMEGLIKDPAGIIDLPKHFSYSIISNEKDLMNDGLLVPPNADGMTCLSLDEKRVVLIRNHEIGHVPRLSTFFKNNPFGKYYRKYKKNNANKFYDINGSTTHCFGGTTSIVYNIESEEWTSLSALPQNMVYERTAVYDAINGKIILMGQSGNAGVQYTYSYDIIRYVRWICAAEISSIFNNKPSTCI